MRHSVSIGLYCFSLILIYWCSFFMFQTVRSVWVKRFYGTPMLCCFFALLLFTASPLKTFYMSLHSTKNLIKTLNINHSWLFKLGEWNNRHPIYQFSNFILGRRFTFKAYAKIVREETSKCSLKTAEVLLDADEHVLTYVSYLSKYSSSKLFKEPQKILNSFKKKICLMSNLKFTLSDVTSFLLDNLYGLYIQACARPTAQSGYYKVSKHGKVGRNRSTDTLTQHGASATRIMDVLKCRKLWDETIWMQYTLR